MQYQVVEPRNVGKRSAVETRSALLLIDLQTDYISGGDLVAGQPSHLLEAFPELPSNVASLLAGARNIGMPICHIRQRDTTRQSKWLPWWESLHPPGGVGFGSECIAEPWAAEQKGEPVFVKHCYDAFMSGDISDRLIQYLKNLRVKRL